MPESIFSEMTCALRGRYGAGTPVGDRYLWTTLLRVVAGPRKKSGTMSPKDDGALASAREVAGLSVSRIGEALEESGWPSRQAKAVHGLARWWLKDADREAEEPRAWERPVETLRNELRAIPGVNLTLADRILLHVGGLGAFPIDRAAMRIAGRHGWMESMADYDEWQSFFVRGAADSGAELESLAEWFAAVGRDYCGARAKCEECPLRGLLPAAGPLPIDGEEL